MKRQRTLNNQEEPESDRAWNNVSTAAKCCCIDEDKMQIKSKITQHLLDESDFNFVKMQLLNCFSDHITQLGNHGNVSSELPRQAMMDLKQMYQHSNRHKADFQIIWKDPRKEVFQYQELNANAANHNRDDDMPLTKALITPTKKNLRPEIKTLDDMGEWCPMPIGELQHHIACCFKWFTDFTEYVYDNQYYSHLNDVKYPWYNTVAIPGTSYQSDEQAVHMVHCTGSTWWKKQKLPSNDTAHFWMGTSSDSHFTLAAGDNPLRLKCLFIVEDAEWSFKRLLAQIQTFATGPVNETSRLVIVE